MKMHLCDVAGWGASLEENDVLRTVAYHVGIDEASRRANAELAMGETSLETDRDLGGGAGAILDREGVDRTGDVGVAPIRREDAAAHDDVGDRAGKGRNPPQRALPCHLRSREIARDTADAKCRLEEGRSRTLQKVRTAGELDRGTRSSMQHTERVQGTVDGMDARQRDPVVPGDLPGNSRRRERCHDRLCILGGDRVE